MSFSNPMPRAELEEQLIQQWKERRTFTLPVLWADDEGVPEVKLKRFTAAARAEVTVVTDPASAVQTWSRGEHLVLITDHRLGTGGYGHQVVEAVFQTGIAPSGLFILTSYITPAETEAYQRIYPFISILSKDMPYDQLGRMCRRQTEDVMAADCMMPSQLIRLRSVRPQPREE